MQNFSPSENDADFLNVPPARPTWDDIPLDVKGHIFEILPFYVQFRYLLTKLPPLPGKGALSTPLVPESVTVQDLLYMVTVHPAGLLLSHTTPRQLSSVTCAVDSPLVPVLASDRRIIDDLTLLVFCPVGYTPDQDVDFHPLAKQIAPRVKSLTLRISPSQPDRMDLLITILQHLDPNVAERIEISYDRWSDESQTDTGMLASPKLVNACKDALFRLYSVKYVNACAVFGDNLETLRQLVREVNQTRLDNGKGLLWAFGAIVFLSDVCTVLPKTLSKLLHEVPTFVDEMIRLRVLPKDAATILMAIGNPAYIRCQAHAEYFMRDFNCDPTWSRLPSSASKLLRRVCDFSSLRSKVVHTLLMYDINCLFGTFHGGFLYQLEGDEYHCIMAAIDDHLSDFVSTCSAKDLHRIKACIFYARTGIEKTAKAFLLRVVHFAETWRSQPPLIHHTQRICDLFRVFPLCDEFDAARGFHDLFLDTVAPLLQSICTELTLQLQDCSEILPYFRRDYRGECERFAARCESAVEDLRSERDNVAKCT